MVVKTVGRGQDNSVVVDDGKVSRTHLQIVQDNSGKISLVDLNSTNGTYVNGRRIVGETPLNAGDEVRIGDTILQWEKLFETESQVVPNPPLPPSPESSTPQPTKSLNKKWVFIAGSVLVIVIIGGVFLFIKNKKESEKKQQELMTENEMYRAKTEELENAQREAAIYQTEYEKAMEEAIKTKFTQDKEKEISLREEVAKRNNEVKEMTNEMTKNNKRHEEEIKKVKDEKLKIEKDKDKEKKDAEAKINAANAEKDKAIKSAKEKAKKEKLAERKLQLTVEFYDALDKAREENTLEQICDVLILPKNKKDKEKEYYSAINKEFKKHLSLSDTNECKKIITIVKKSNKELKNMSKNGVNPIKTDSK